MDRVELGFPPDASVRLTPDASDPLEIATVDLRVGALSASTEIEDPYRTGFRSLADFFSAMAEDWRGWTGTRSWRSVEGHLGIEGRHDGHVQLDISMVESNSSRWSLKAHLALEPGEQVRQAADDLYRLGRS